MTRKTFFRCAWLAVPAAEEASEAVVIFKFLFVATVACNLDQLVVVVVVVDCCC